MRPYVVGGACHRVQQQIDAGLAEGSLTLSAELAAHASRCPHCAPLVAETDALFQRLRGAVAGIDLGPVPGVVDAVLERIALEGVAPVVNLPLDRVEAEPVKKASQTRWVLGQVATFAAVLLVAAGGLTMLALLLNQAVSGVHPGEVVGNWVAPLQDWSQTLFKGAK